MNTIRRAFAAIALLGLCYAATPQPEQSNASVIHVPVADVKLGEEAAYSKPPAIASLAPNTCPCGDACKCGLGAACDCQSKLTAAAAPPVPVKSPAQAPATPGGRYELRSRRVGFRQYQNYWQWVPNQAVQYYAPACNSRGGCSSCR